MSDRRIGRQIWPKLAESLAPRPSRYDELAVFD
jgi:hypothetical protein